MSFSAILAAILFCASLLAAAPPARAEAPVLLVLDPTASIPNLAPFMRYAADEGLPTARLIEAYTAGRLSADFAAVARDAAPYQGVWGLVELTNGAPADDRGRDSWLLVSHVTGLIALDAFLVRLGAETEQVLANDLRQRFDPTQFSATLLRSAPIALAPGEQALLLVRMVHGAVDSAVLSLDTPADLQRATFRLGMQLAGFYAFMAASLVFFAAFAATLRDGTALAYAGLLALALLFLAYLDNLLFRLAYPEMPGAHLPVGLTLLWLLIAAGFLAAALSLGASPGQARLARVLRRVALAAAAVVLLVPFVAADILAPAAYAALAAMMAAQVLAIHRWEATGSLRHPAFRAISVVALAGVGLAVALALARVEPGFLSIGALIKGIYGVLAALIMGGLSLSLIDIRRAHAAAQQGRIDALRAEAAATRGLLEAERNYSRARDLAERRRADLANMSHDIRQPLASLRLTMSAALQDAPAPVRARLAEAFDYLQGLTRVAADESPVAEPATEPWPLSLILVSLDQMFGAEARDRGTALRVVASSVEVAVPPLVVMRIAANLTANAIRHAGHGRVLVGVRRQGGQAVLQVLDQGPGMTPAEIARYRQRGQSGAESEGEGLGLPICFALAAEQGLTLRVASVPGRGTVFSLALPRDRIGA